jgi:hypothetical protein
MINEVLIAWEPVPYIFERAAAILIGFGMFFHFLQMSNFANEKTPWCIAFMLGLIGFTSVALVFSALAGNMKDMWHFALASTGSVLVLWLWLWHKGLHVNEFLNKKYGEG